MIWDGKNLAAIQMLTCKLSRKHGRPVAEVDRDWHLTVLGIPVPVGSSVQLIIRTDTAQAVLGENDDNTIRGDQAPAG